MNRLRELRTAKKMSIRELSAETEIDFSFICAMENDRRKISIKNGRNLANFFNVSLEYLLGSSFNEKLDGFLNDCKAFYFSSQKIGDEQFEIPRDEPNIRDFYILKIIKNFEQLDEINLKKTLDFINFTLFSNDLEKLSSNK